MHEPPRHPGRATTDSRRLARAGSVALLVLLIGTAVSAAPHALRSPRTPDSIKKALESGPHSGDCNQCHSTHGEDQITVYPNALVSPDDNALCAKCHTTPWSGGSFAGDVLYRGTGHGTSTRMVWPGPDPQARFEPDAPTKCLNCHDPHGWTDAIGEVPQLLLQREEKTCLACHDGSPASTDIANELRKPYRHPTTDYTGRHSGPNESQPSDFGVSPLNNRHAECEDCHNAHVSRDDGPVPATSDASKLVLGVSRVSVLNGAPGSPPLYTFVPASDTLTAPVAEYQLCFKCHSSWTTQPAGQTDFGLVLNPANPSFHPVEDVGRNSMISPLSFTAGWSANSITRCGSCHGTDFGNLRGPHGSTNQYLLRAPYVASPAERGMSTDELCFSCHSYDTYANPNASSVALAASRFNPPGTTGGHALHVGAQRTPCYTCHVTHGSTTLPYLLVQGRMPGIVTWSKTASGGTCTPTCHATQSYTTTYAQ